MSEETLEETAENMVQINLNSVLAAAIKNLGILALPAQDVVADYSEYSIALSLDDETNMFIFELVEAKDVQDES